MDFKYPYDGYSWSITQHVAPATNVNTLFEFLKASYQYSNSSQYQNKITEYMLSKNLLTANVRKDQNKPQLWRDYQQILPEIGLIVSTKFTKGISITPMGLLWLDGAIGYSELMTTQCINYQYPNGHKQDLSPVVQKQISSLKTKIDNRVVLDSIHGVLIKPATLILRVLIELSKSGDFDGISTDETVICLMPNKKNDEWPEALQRLKVYRKGKAVFENDTRRKRHVQEWYRLLAQTDLFSLSRNKMNQRISLSLFAAQNINFIDDFCKLHEKKENFWIPPSEDSRQLGLSWFNYFGSPNIERQWATEVDHLTPQYIDTNYPEGIYEADEGDEKEFSGFDLNLRVFKENKKTDLSKPFEANIERIAEGHIKRDERTKLHDKIVGALANRMIALDYQVLEDKSSVDLLARKSGTEVIFEVKTVNKNNLSRHLRLGVGQLLEYRYRRQLQIENRPRALLVLSSNYNFPVWIKDYFHSEINVGLLSFIGDCDFLNITQGKFERKISSFNS